jgi:hypothetical protein
MHGLLQIFFVHHRLDEDQRKAVRFVAYIPPELYDNDQVTPKVTCFSANESIVVAALFNREDQS